jgi:hypothetical protein
LGPLGTVATNRPIVLAPGEDDDGEIGGMMIGRSWKEIFLSADHLVSYHEGQCAEASS